MATPEDNFRVEIWTDDEKALVETISRSSDFVVSLAAWHAAIRRRPGTLLLHRNDRFIMERMVTPGEKQPATREGIDACLDDLRHWHGLRAMCKACGHLGMMDTEQLKKRVGGKTSISEIEGKLKCTACKVKQVRLEIQTMKRD